MTDSRIEAGGIIQTRRLTLLGIMAAPDRPGIGAAIFDALGKAGVSAQFIVQGIDLTGVSNVLFCVSEHDAERAREIVQTPATELQALAVEQQPGVALLSVFGPDFRERPGIAGAVFRAMAGRSINILAISTSISTISCVIRDADVPAAIEALHEAIKLP